MNTIRITTTQNIELEYDLAGLGERIAGYILDMLIIVAYVIIVMMIASRLSVFTEKNGWIFVIIFLPVVFYDLACEVLLNGQSVGKKVMKIKVISIDGSQPTLGQYMIRWLFRLVDFSLSNGLCALICVAVSERKQRVGDMVAGTTLIKTQPRTAFQQTLYTPTPDTNYTVSFPDVVTLSDSDMQLIKEVTLQIKKTGNNYLAYHAAEKIKQLLHIETNLEPAHFLQVVIADYNHLTSNLDR
jgi:uncharacterized RDD family membrane protein YckC